MLKTVVITNCSLVIFCIFVCLYRTKISVRFFTKKKLKPQSFDVRTVSKFFVLYMKSNVFLVVILATATSLLLYLSRESNNSCYFALFSNFFFPNLQILEKSLRTLFETRDLSLVKKYVQRQCSKLMEGRASIQDFTFAKEYRGMKSYKPGACVPALELTR